MKSIKDLLPEKTVNTLIQICRVYNLKGYSVLKKDDLIVLIIENLKNYQVKENIKSLIPNNGTTALILKSFIDNKNEIGYSNLRREVLKKRSGSAFRHYFQELMINFILFENESSDDDTLYLPKEFNNFAKKVIDEKLEEDIPEDHIEILSKEEEEKEKKEINTIDRLLYSKKYTDVETLSNLLKRLNKLYSGNKSQLIERLLYESEMSVENIIDKIFGKNDLREICIDFNLFFSGNKIELTKRILDKLPPASPKKVFKSKPKPKIVAKKIKSKHERAEIMASRKAEKKLQVIKTKTSKIETEDLTKKVYNFLNKYKLDYMSITKQEILQASVFSALNSLNQFIDGFKDARVTRIKKEPLILIEKNNKIIPISVWYFDKNKSPTPQKERITHRNMLYNDKYGKELISYIYDPGSKLDNDTRTMYENLLKLIYKTERQFNK